ncbi:MAG: cation diffusion facilitator family transporter [Desulfobulbaceae bacterium]|nr:cation diffusion facilitator family transporter [Desulfobulbaceae bacterium]HIJ90554.1 cation transporter [Deltaproteobacteria bacterium]
MSRTSLSQCNSNGTLQECLACEKKAIWVAVYANFTLAIFKAFIGIVSGSMAMLGDALFSFKDFIASLVGVIGIRVSGKPADEQHPYGHGKVEFVALFLISMGLLLATLFLLFHSLKGIWHCSQGFGRAPKLVVFGAALISVVANYKLVQYLSCVGDRQKSHAIRANTRQNHSGALSSIMVAVAILGARLGYVFLDPLVALVEAVCLLFMGRDMFLSALKGLFDSAAPAATVERIESVARIVPGVRKVAKIVVRQQGQGLWIEMMIKIDPDLTHQEGYLIGLHVKESILATFGNKTTVNVSFEPYMP